MPEPGEIQPEFEAEPKKIDKELRAMEINWGNVFDENESTKAVVKEIISRVKPILDRVFTEKERVDAIEAAIKECENITSKEQFLGEVFSAIEPVLEFRRENPEAFDKIVRGVTTERIEHSGGTMLSEVLYYGMDEEMGVVDIHVTSSRDLGIAKTARLFREGLEKLAVIVKENDRIKKVVATSWIIEDNPDVIVKKFGFSLESGKEDTAIMSREDFLEKYLK